MALSYSIEEYEEMAIEILDPNSVTTDILPARSDVPKLENITESTPVGGRVLSDNLTLLYPNLLVQFTLSGVLGTIP